MNFEMNFISTRSVATIDFLNGIKRCRPKLENSPNDSPNYSNA